MVILDTDSPALSSDNYCCRVSSSGSGVVGGPVAGPSGGGTVSFDPFDDPGPRSGHPVPILSAHAPARAGGLAQGGAPDQQESEIWIANNSFIPSSEWLEKASESYQQKTALYPANVPYTITGVKSTNIGKIYGSNFLPTNDDCGTIYRKVFCNADASHKPASLHIRCNDPGCPVCYKKPANRIASRVSERVARYKTAYYGKRIDALVFWPKKGTVYADMKDAFKDAYRMLGEMGADAAAVMIHSHRIREELKPKMRQLRMKAKMLGRKPPGFWELAHDDALGLGPLENYTVPGIHFHAQVSGFLKNSKVYYEETGAGYKKTKVLKTEEDMQKDAYYLATHAIYEFGKDSVRYYGLMSKHKLKRVEVGETFLPVACEICGCTMADYAFNSDTGELSGEPVHPVLRRKKKLYEYVVRGRESPHWRDGHLPKTKNIGKLMSEAKAAQDARHKGWDLA